MREPFAATLARDAVRDLSFRASERRSRVPDGERRAIFRAGTGSVPIVACHDCDLLHQLGPVPEGGTARCARCGGVLRKRTRNGLERTLALSLAACAGTGAHDAAGVDGPPAEK